MPQVPQIFPLVFPQREGGNLLTRVTVHYGNGNTQTFLGLLKSGFEVRPIPRTQNTTVALPPHIVGTSGNRAMNVIWPKSFHGPSR